jgi:two-component system cell cycle response regulator
MSSSHLLSPDYSDPPLRPDQPQRVAIQCATGAVGELLIELCDREGCEAGSFAQPEALLRDPDLTFDLVVLHADVDDPGCLEVCLDLRATDSFRHAPILLVTSVPADSKWVARALLGGADDVCSLDEPHRQELRARTRVHLRNKRYRDAIGRLRKERNDLRSRNKLDALTGALGRGALEIAVQAELDAAVTFAVLFVDVDHFKSVNDTYGHQMGDVVLKGVAAALATGCRAGDACGRYGGEEFVLLLRHVNREQAIRVAERHRAAVARQRFGDRGGPDHVTVSIGVAVFDPEAPDPSMASLLSRADAALYRAKHEGRDRVIMARPFPPPASA